MSAIQNSIQLVDNVTPILRTINSTLNTVLDSVQMMDNTNISPDFTAISQGLINAESSIIRINEQITRINSSAISPNVDTTQMQSQIERLAGIRAQPSIAPAEQMNWQGSSEIQVFNNTGAERFTQELNSAQQMTDRLRISQQQMIQLAQNTRILPDSAISDLSTLDGRINAVRMQLARLERVPISLQTNGASSQIERLRMQLNDAVIEQGNLNNAVRNMDASSANNSYQQLNNTMDSIERNIRDNISAQNNFNAAINNGSDAASSLQSKIAQIGGAIATYMGISKILGLSDAYAQTSARLNLMNDGMQTTEELQNKIFVSAQSSRSAYQETAQFVAKIGTQAGDAFKSSDEAIMFAEQLNKTFKIAGTAPQEQASAMLQLSQALSSGVLRGEELNAVFESAQPVIQNIADYLGEPVGAIREMAKEGQITADIVKNAMFAASDETNQKFESIPKTWSDIWASIENEGNKAFWPVFQQLSQIANSESFNSLSTGIVVGLGKVADVATKVMNEVVYWGGVICTNWSFIQPVIWGIVGAMSVYKGSILALSIAEGISNVIKIAGIIATQGQAASAIIAADANLALTAAQWGLNTAILACPVTWIVVGIIAVVTAVYLVVAAYNRWTNSSISATGIIVGTFFVAGAFIYNLFAGIMNFVANSFGVSVYNSLADLGNFMGNFCINPCRAIVVLFLDLSDTILGILQGIAQAIDTVFGSNLSGSVNGFRSTLKGWTNSIPGDHKEFFKKRENVEVFERIDYGAAYTKGYQYGDNISNPFALPDQEALGSNTFNLDPASTANLEDTARNTGKMKDSLDITEEDLKYLRDVAEQEIVNRFTTPEINVHMVNNNTINSEMDLDGISNGLREKIIEEVNISAEGEHK